MRNSLSADENFELSQRQSPYQAKRKSGSRIRHEPVYLQEIINTDSGYPSSSPVSINLLVCLGFGDHAVLAFLLR